jgi:hypothetical protein
MPATYEPIYTTTLGSNQANITFNSFGGYTDLLLVATIKMALYDGVNLNLNVNSDTGSNYSWTALRGNGSSATSTRQSNQAYMDGDTYGIMDTTSFAQYNIAFMNYANSTTYKTMLSRATSAGRGTEAVVNLWRNTSAITSIVLDCGADSFATGSTFTLYGIKAA